MFNFEEINKVNNYLKNIRAGEKNKIADLFNYMNGKMTFFAKMYLYDKSLVQDVIQDSLINIMRYIDSFDSTKNSINWIIKIVKNAAMKYNHRADYSDSIEADNCELSYNDMIEEKITIENAVIKLSDVNKKLFVQYFVYEYNMREIARMEKVSKSLISKRVTALKKILLNEFVGDYEA